TLDRRQQAVHQWEGTMAEARAETSGAETGRTGRGGVRTVGVLVIIPGILFAVAGVIAYVAVQQTLSDQKIVVADDADMFAGKQVHGPFTAYSQAMGIGQHPKEV